MSLIFKFEGTPINNNKYEIMYKYIGLITLNRLKGYFRIFGIKETEIYHVLFHLETKQVCSPLGEIYVSADEIIVFNVYTSNEEIRSKLINIFEKHNNKKTIIHINDPEMKIDLHNTENSLPLQEEKKENINKNDSINIELIKLFDNNNFKKILSLYLKKPKLFYLLFQYTQNVNMAPINEDYQNKLSKEDDDYYDDLTTVIKKLDLDISDYNIKKTLIKFSGHLNLTLRALLQPKDSQAPEKKVDNFMNKEIINNSNMKAAKLFDDPDFQLLLSFYIKEPKIYNLLFHFVQSGTMVNQDTSNSKDKNYDNLLEEFKKLGMQIPDNVIKEKLIRFSGNLGVTLRSVLQDIVINNKSC